MCGEIIQSNPHRAQFVTNKSNSYRTKVANSGLSKGFVPRVTIAPTYFLLPTYVLDHSMVDASMMQFMDEIVIKADKYADEWYLASIVPDKASRIQSSVRVLRLKSNKWEGCVTSQATVPRPSLTLSLTRFIHFFQLL